LPTEAQKWVEASLTAVWGETAGDSEEAIEAATDGSETLLSIDPTVDHSLKLRAEDRGLRGSVPYRGRVGSIVPYRRD